MTCLAFPQRPFMPNQFSFVNRPEQRPSFVAPELFQPEGPIVPQPSLVNPEEDLRPQFSPFDVAVNIPGFGSLRPLAGSSEDGQGSHEIEQPTTPSVTTTMESVTTTEKPSSSVFDLVPSLNRTLEVVRNILNLGRFRRQAVINSNVDFEAMESLVVPVAFMPANSLRASSGVLVKSGKLVGLNDDEPVIMMLEEENEGQETTTEATSSQDPMNDSSVTESTESTPCSQ